MGGKKCYFHDVERRSAHLCDVANEFSIIAMYCKMWISSVENECDQLKAKVQLNRIFFHLTKPSDSLSSIHQVGNLLWGNMKHQTSFNYAYSSCPSNFGDRQYHVPINPVFLTA